MERTHVGSGSAGLAIATNIASCLIKTTIKLTCLLIYSCTTDTACAAIAATCADASTSTAAAVAAIAAVASP